MSDLSGTLHCALVDVQAEAIRNTEESLRPFGVEVRACNDFDALLELIGAHSVDAVLLDIARMVREPLQRLLDLREGHPDLPIILLGNMPVDNEKVEDCLRHGADSFQVKPILGLNLERAIRNQRRRKRDSRLLDNQSDGADQALLSQVIKAKREFEDIFDAMPWPMVLVNPEGSILRANLATTGNDPAWFRRIIGRPAHKDVLKAGAEVLKEGSTRRRILQNACTVQELPGSPVFEVAELISWPVHNEREECSGSVHMLVDRSRIERLETLLRSQEKQSTIGLLASGLAHNLSSPLQAIQGKLQLMELAESAPAQELEFLRRTTTRMTDMVSNLMYKLRRDQDPERRPVSLNEVLHNEIQLLEANMVFKHEVSCEVDLDESLEPVMAVHGDVSQAINNLLQNAVQAMHNCPQKQLRIRSRQAESGYSRIEIEDSGKGISRELRERVWEPFFTTKPMAGEAANGEPTGTGLGLSSSRYLLRKNDLGLDFESVVGEGTTFIISWRRSS